MDPDPDSDPPILVLVLQEANKKIIIKSFSAYYFLNLHLHHFSKIKSQKEVESMYHYKEVNPMEITL